MMGRAASEDHMHTTDDGPNKRPCREDTMTVSAYVKTSAGLALRELVGRLGVEKGHRFTTQQAVCEALVDFFIKHGAKPPPELEAAARPCTDKATAHTSQAPAP